MDVVGKGLVEGVERLVEGVERLFCWRSCRQDASRRIILNIWNMNFVCPCNTLLSVATLVCLDQVLEFILYLWRSQS